MDSIQLSLLKTDLSWEPWHEPHSWTVMQKQYFIYVGNPFEFSSKMVNGIYKYT